MSIKYSIFNTDCPSIISYNIDILIIFFIKILFKLLYIAALFGAYITSHDIVAAMNMCPKKCSFVAQCIVECVVNYVCQKLTLLHICISFS